MTRKSNYDLNVTLWYNLRAKLLIPESIDWPSSSTFPCCLFFVVCPTTATLPLSSAFNYTYTLSTLQIIMFLKTHDTGNFTRNAAGGAFQVQHEDPLSLLFQLFVTGSELFCKNFFLVSQIMLTDCI